MQTASTAIDEAHLRVRCAVDGLISESRSDRTAPVHPIGVKGVSTRAICETQSRRSAPHFFLREPFVSSSPACRRERKNIKQIKRVPSSEVNFCLCWRLFCNLSPSFSVRFNSLNGHALLGFAAARSASDWAAWFLRKSSVETEMKKREYETIVAASVTVPWIFSHQPLRQ